jgi:hypothetical protein
LVLEEGQMTGFDGSTSLESHIAANFVRELEVGEFAMVIAEVVDLGV